MDPRPHRRRPLTTSPGRSGRRGRHSTEQRATVPGCGQPRAQGEQAALDLLAELAIAIAIRYGLDIIPTSDAQAAGQRSRFRRFLLERQADRGWAHVVAHLSPGDTSRTFACRHHLSPLGHRCPSCSRPVPSWFEACAFEDKVLQRAVVMVLECIYEQDFLGCSYGFRPGRSAHQALRALHLANGLVRCCVLAPDLVGPGEGGIAHGSLRPCSCLQVPASTKE